jgi:ribonuclease E
MNDQAQAQAPAKDGSSAQEHDSHSAQEARQGSYFDAPQLAKHEDAQVSDSASHADAATMKDESRTAVQATTDASSNAALSSHVAAPSAKASMPSIGTYDLPIESLVSLTESSNLQWVQSDPQKVAQVREIIANEPAPVRVPRLRPPPVVIDEGPLVLVETKKSLSQLNLPFTQESK